MRHNAKASLFLVLLLLLACTLCACINNAQDSDQSGNTSEEGDSLTSATDETTTPPFKNPFEGDGTIELPNDYFYPPEN